MPLLLNILFLTGFDPSVLTVPIVHAEQVDQKQIWQEALAECESGGDENAKVIDTNGYWSRGRYQYQLSTWLRYSELFGTTRENIFNGDLQDKVTRYVLDTYGSSDWMNCTRQVKKTLGEYPSKP